MGMVEILQRSTGAVIQGLLFHHLLTGFKIVCCVPGHDASSQTEKLQDLVIPWDREKSLQVLILLDGVRFCR